MVTQIDAPSPAADGRSASLPRRTMGYLPALDGLRAVSVAAVILYHAHALGAVGLGWAQGGFFGVEVFFVISGYLITTLLLEEQHRDGSVDVRQFWLRRARRLLPALFVMLAAVTVAAAVGRPDTLARLRLDMPWAVLYTSNWAQVFAKTGYFAALATPPLLRHLWSLAVEEQWYLVWPLVAAWLLRRWGSGGPVARSRRLALPVLGAAAIAMASMAVLYRPDPERINLVYLATFTRAGGLLLGAALAFVWRPWAWPGAGRGHLVVHDAVGFTAIAGLAVTVVTLANGDAGVYRGGMALVSVLSAVAVAMAVHPGARWMGALFAHPALAAVGRRSYGLYLWHWPVFVLLRAGDSWARLLLAAAVAVVVSEACYRLVEGPVRHGALGRWWAAVRGAGRSRGRALLTATLPVLLLVPAGVRMATASTPDAAQDTKTDVSFDSSAAGTDTSAGSTAPPAVDSGTSVAPDDTTPTTVAPSTTAPPPPARRVVLVGDSQAHSLAVNQPAGIEKVLSITDGSVDGCGLLQTGRLQSSRGDWTKEIAECKTWPAKWAAAARSARAEVALVMIGAWDLFDVERPDGWYVFGTDRHDAELTARLDDGIAALKGTGAKVALLEVACMRPIESPQSPVPLLPERGDDRRVKHLNDLLRAAAAADPDNVFFVPGPTAWCNDPAIAQDLSFRWDGVHVYKPGAKLIFETIAAPLLAIPVGG